MVSATVERFGKRWKLGHESDQKFLKNLRELAGQVSGVPDMELLGTRLYFLSSRWQLPATPRGFRKPDDNDQDDM